MPLTVAARRKDGDAACGAVHATRLATWDRRTGMAAAHVPLDSVAKGRGAWFTGCPRITRGVASMRMSSRRDQETPPLAIAGKITCLARTRARGVAAKTVDAEIGLALVLSCASVSQLKPVLAPASAAKRARSAIVVRGARGHARAIDAGVVAAIDRVLLAMADVIALRLRGGVDNADVHAAYDPRSIMTARAGPVAEAVALAARRAVVGAVTVRVDAGLCYGTDPVHPSRSNA